MVKKTLRDLEQTAGKMGVAVGMRASDMLVNGQHAAEVIAMAHRIKFDEETAIIVGSTMRLNAVIAVFAPLAATYIEQAKDSGATPEQATAHAAKSLRLLLKEAVDVCIINGLALVNAVEKDEKQREAEAATAALLDELDKADEKLTGEEAKAALDRLESLIRGGK